MLKVIIADDEKVIRESIAQCIDWNSLDLELVGTYPNGVEAFDGILNESPDIVMTDIKMPGMSGLELIEKVSSMNMDTQFIVLSGFSEFSYAQSAMRFGVRHYLLKPCNEDQITGSLKEVRKLCCQQRALHEYSEEHREIANSLHQNIIMDLLSQGVNRPDHYQNISYEPYQKHIDFLGTKYQLHFLNNVSEENLSSVYTTVLEFHKLHAPGIPLHGVYVKNRMILFFQDHPFSWILEDAIRKQTGFQEEIHLESQTLPNLSVTMDALLLLIRQHETIFYISEGRKVPIQNYRTVMDLIKKRCLAISTAANSDQPLDTQARLYSIESLILQLKSINSLDFLKQQAASILFILSDHGLCCSLLECTEKIAEFARFNDVVSFRNSFIPWLEQALTETADSSGLKGKLVKDIKEYVEKNLADPNLTLKSIARDYLFMNVDYVSKCFLKETGMKFSTYLREVRIQKAKELIAADESNKLQNIAEYVGLGNSPQYFSQVFRKQTGMTPSAYSSMIHKR